MSERRAAIIDRFLAERTRQFDLPGAEADANNSPNDWIAIASHYLSEPVRKGFNKPDREAFEDGLIKAAAVILAALENVDGMVKKEKLS